MVLNPDTGPVENFQVRLLGGFDVRLNDRPLPHLRSRKEQWLLALLVLRWDRDTPRDWLASTLWPDNEEQQSLFYLRKSLTNLRKALASEASRLLSPTPRTVRLDLVGAFADVVAFDNAVATVTPQEAIRLYRGPLLPDCVEEWAAVERNQREQAYLAALESLARQLQESGDPASAVHWLRQLVSADPYRESACCALMQALADCGDTAAIKVVYQELRLRLRQELNTAPSVETDQLYQQAIKTEKTRIAAMPSASTADSRRHLPVPLSDLIGRQDEVAEVLDCLKRRRLATFVGAGGIGKTRLAIAVGEAALERFEHGVWFVDLAAVTDELRVPDTAAKALGIAEERSRPLMETIVDNLANRSLLLILDNCEHLLDASASMAHTLLSACPGLVIVATSRQPLNVMGEQVYRVPSLLVPPVERDGSGTAAADQEKDPHFLMEYEAICLFVDRACRADSTFRLNRRNAAAVVDICRKLDGIPLAIEMAAARLRSLSVGEIRTRLADRFQLLTIGSRGVLPRQQTLRAAIDWSYDLLSEVEAQLLNRLSVFVGGWTLDSAEGVCGEFVDVPETLASLVDKSLVLRREGADESVRYGMLESIRQYALERAAAGEGDALNINVGTRRHRDYFLILAELASAKSSGPERACCLATLDAEYDNLRQAAAFCLADPDSGELGLRYCTALWWYWRARGHLTEGREVCAALLSHAGAQSRSNARADALNAAGVLAFSQSDFAIAQEQLKESLAIFRELGNSRGAASSLANLASVAATQGEYAAAQDLYEDSLQILRGLDDQRGICNCLNGLGNIAQELGNIEAARALHEESLSIERLLGDRHGVAISLNNLGILADVQGDYSSAHALFAESLEIHRELGPRMAEAANLAGLGNVAFHEGRYVVARSYYEQSLNIRRQLGETWGIAISLQGLAETAAHLGELVSAHALHVESLEIRQKLGDRLGVAESFKSLASLARHDNRPERAAHLWGASFALHDAIGSPISAGQLHEMEPDMAAAREMMGEDEFTAARTAGGEMSLEQAIEYALSK